MADKKPHDQTGRGNLRPPWKPGESGNPSGRPKRRPITDGYIAMARQKMPPEMCRQLGLNGGCRESTKGNRAGGSRCSAALIAC